VLLCPEGPAGLGGGPEGPGLAFVSLPLLACLEGWAAPVPFPCAFVLSFSCLTAGAALALPMLGGTRPCLGPLLLPLLLCPFTIASNSLTGPRGALPGVGSL